MLNSDALFIEQVEKLRADNKTWDEIGTTLGTTGGAVRSKMDRLKIKSPEKFTTTKRWQALTSEGPIWMESQVINNTVEDFSTTINDIVSKYTKPENIEYKYKEIHSKNNVTILNLYLADLHVGLCTDEEWNKGSLDKIKNQIVDFVFDINDSFTNDIKVNIFCIGDMVDGMNGRTTRGTELGTVLSNKEQYEELFNFICSLYENIATYFPVELHTISNSNHGGDFEYLIFEVITKFLQGKYPNNSITNTKDFCIVKEYNGHKILLTHGNDDKYMMRGLPKNLTDTAEMNILKRFEEYGVSLLDKNLRVVKADLHVSNSNEGRFIKQYRNVLAVCPTSKWIKNNFTLSLQGVSFDLILPSGLLITGDKEL